MSNKTSFLNELELEEHLREMSDREIIEFTARQTYDVCNLASSNERRIVTLENKGNKVTGIVGGAGTFVGAAITTLINFFVNKG